MSNWPFEGFWKRWLDPIIHANLWVAFGALAMAEATIISLDLGQNSVAPLFLFCVTLFTYNFQRLFKSKGVDVQSHSARHLWIARYNERLRMIMLVALFGAVITAVFVKIEALMVLAPFGAISIFYSIRVIPGRGRKLGFRDVPYIKVFLITATWVAVTVILPVVDIDMSRVFGDDIMAAVIERAFFVLAITIPFDIRDVNRDALSKRTIAQVFGQAGARWISVLLMLVFCFLVWTSDHYSDNVRYALMLSGFLTAGILSFARSDRTERFFTFLVEGAMVLQWVLLMLFQ